MEENETKDSSLPTPNKSCEDGKSKDETPEESDFILDLADTLHLGSRRSVVIFMSIMMILILTFVAVLVAIFNVSPTQTSSDALDGFGMFRQFSPVVYNEMDNERFKKSPPFIHKTAPSIRRPSLITAHPLSFPPTPAPDQCLEIPDEIRFDCLPDYGPDQEKCYERGCCWRTPDITAPLNLPYCYFPSGYVGYTYKNVSEAPFGLTAFLQRKTNSGYPRDVNLLRMDVMFEEDHRLHVKIYDAERARYEVPVPQMPKTKRAALNPHYDVNIMDNSDGFQVSRRSTGQILFDSVGAGSLIFSDQFLSISSYLPSDNIYGLGEHRAHLRRDLYWKTYTMWNKDGIPTENENLYGSHPFYMATDRSGSSHGVLLFNSNAMDVVLQPAPAVTFRTIGGVLDLYFFLGPSPADVIRQYTQLVGRPSLPPYWALGFHLCRFGYNTLNKTKEVWKRTRDAEIPFDVQWNDIDYMDKRKDFTYSKAKYEGLPEFVKQLHDVGMHYIPIIDPGISNSEKPGTYRPYDLGNKLGVFVKDHNDKEFVGKVWTSGTTVWPDFTHPKAVDYWTQQLRSYHDQVQFDGAWIDMNEPSNFFSGTQAGCPSDSSFEHPPYLPGVTGGKLYYKTLCMTAKQHHSIHYNVHNIYGLTEAIATHFALKEIRKKRPVIISRSTFVGQGRYSGHWTGDVVSAWHDLAASIPAILNYNLYGIPLVGADICGFNGNTTIPLCNRWMQLGAFYPFSRNHNTDDGIDQDPVAMGPLVEESSRRALKARYRMLPYLYSLFWRAHIDGDTVARPLFFEFPRDKNTFGIDDSFLWGPALLILPVLRPDQQKIDRYFPAGVWYDYYSGKVLRSGGRIYEVPAPNNTIPLYIRGGYIIPAQYPELTTTQSRRSKFELLVALNYSRQAEGELFWDDGDSLNAWETHSFNLVKFVSEKQSVMSSPIQWGYKRAMPLGSIKVMGVPPPVQTVRVNGVIPQYSYNQHSQVLEVEGLNEDMRKPVHMKWA